MVCNQPIQHGLMKVQFIPGRNMKKGVVLRKQQAHLKCCSHEIQETSARKSCTLCGQKIAKGTLTVAFTHPQNQASTFRSAHPSCVLQACSGGEVKKEKQRKPTMRMYVLPDQERRSLEIFDATFKQKLFDENLTLPKLRALWGVLDTPQLILAFYGHKETHSPTRFLSNFYVVDPYTVKVNDEEFTVTSSEQHLMLLKASLFEDASTLREIALSTTPKDAKRLGRRVKNFNLKIWQANILRIAELVVYTKFKHANCTDIKVNQSPIVVPLKDIFLHGFRDDTIFAEFAATDLVWGTGVSISSKTIENVPADWTGTNVLGWALTKTLHRLRQEQSQPKQTARTTRKRGPDSELIADNNKQRKE